MYIDRNIAIFATSKFDTTMRISELKRILLKFGCYVDKENSRHEWWFSPITKQHFPVPRHNSQEIPKGTLNNIKEQSGIKL